MMFCLTCLNHPLLNPAQDAFYCSSVKVKDLAWEICFLPFLKMYSSLQQKVDKSKYFDMCVHTIILGEAYKHNKNRM